ncbi:hypothetical protein EMCRGX_G015017 [Ephydatia muelleri]
MAYVIHQVSGLPTSPKARLIDSVSYPPKEIQDKIFTRITLWEVESNVGGMLTWSYWRSFFNGRPDYNVLVHQKCPLQNKTYTFVAHECDDEEVARDALRAVSKTLEPLVDDCSVTLTKQLLEGILIPHPRDPSDLSNVLTELMHVNPSAYPFWSTLFEALWKEAIGLDQDASKKPALDKHSRFLKVLDTFNGDGFTPLMIAVMKDNTDCAVALLQADANPNVQNLESGNSALHYAAEMCNETILKALIVFGGDISMKNKAGQTPLNIALKATEGDAEVCVKVLREIGDLIKKAKDEYANPQSIRSFDSDSVFLLCIDGGGVRGLLALQILIAIRNRMLQIQPDCALLQDYFDYMAGTSIGGMVTLSLTAQNSSLEECRADLFRNVDYMFPTKPTFTVLAADGSCKVQFGSERKMSDIKRPRIIIHTVEANVNPPILHKIRNFGKNSGDWKVWEAGRSTTAAPIYFPPHKDTYIDGGVMANNPTLSAMTDIVTTAAEEGKQLKIGLVLSIGTGHGAPIPVDHVGVYVPSISNLKSLPNTLSALGSIVNLFIGQSTSSDGEAVDCARAWSMSLGAEYFRLSPLLSTPIDLAEYKKAPIVQMLYEGVVFGLNSAREIDTIARIILSRKPATDL